MWFSYNSYLQLCHFLRIPLDNSNDSNQLKFHKSNKHIKNMPLNIQFLLVSMKLRNNFNRIDLAFRFKIDQQSVSVSFNSWLDYMYYRFGQFSFWPHSDVITTQMPPKFKEEYPNTFAILDCTELKIQKRHPP